MKACQPNFVSNRQSFPFASALAGFPFADLESLRDEVGRLFDSGSAAAVPPLDVARTESGLVVTADLPGLSKEDIRISVENNVLTIAGERRAPVRTENSDEAQPAARVLRNERAFGAFQRSVVLPLRVDSARTSAAYRDGVLTVTLPQAEEARPRTVAIES